MKFGGISVVCVLTLLSGCTWLMMSDFDNAREVTAIDIGKVQAVTKTMDLPAGNASISFVVPGYDCQRAMEGAMDIVVRGAKGVIKQETISLSKLTWPKSGNGECFPIGYWEHDGKNSPWSVAFTLHSKELISIDLSIREPATISRTMSVWVVYNSRLPVERMLGKLRT
jgi:hypothetical protein